jgi:hypothetical protein
MPAVLRLSLVACVSFAALALSAPPAPAQTSPLNRCVDANGDTIYTDRRCDEIGAQARSIRSPTGATLSTRRMACARTLRDLVHEISAAIDQRDVNRLGAVYHWVGHDDASGARIYDRLQAIVDRPLVDIAPLRASAPVVPPPTEPPPLPDAPVPLPEAPVATTAATTPTEGQDTTATPPRPARRAPYGLRLQQTLRNGSTPSRTDLRLQRHFDCWWITL